MKQLVILSSLLLLMSCARFRVEGLQQRSVFKVETAVSGADFPAQGGVVHEVPAQVAVMENWVVMSVPSKKKVLFYKNGSLDMILQDQDLPAQTEDQVRTIVNELLNIPGRIIAGRNEDIFIETFVPASSSSAVGFYKILHFNLRGEFLGIIGREGQPQLPFENILWFDVDEQGNLWVEYRYLGKLMLDNYVNSNLNYQVSEQLCFDRLFKPESLDPDRFLYRCEKIIPFFSGKKVMLVGRVEKNQPGEDGEVQSPFQYRKAFAMDRAGTTSEIFNRLADPEDFPYLTHGKDEILLWQTEDYDRIRFAVYNSVGKLQRNYEIRLRDRPQSWRSIYGTIDGKIFGLQLNSDSLQVVRWR